MHKPISLIHVYLVSLVLIILLVFPVLGFFWVKQEISDFRAKSDVLRKEFIDSGRETIKHEVDNAVAYIEFIRSIAEDNLRNKVESKTLEGVNIVSSLFEANKDSLSNNKIKDMAYGVLSSMSWDNGQGYYFAVDMQGTEIINPNNPEMVGTNLIDLQDPKGKYVIKEILDIAKSKEGEGFITYLWNKPGIPGKPIPKISYVKYYEPFNWVIGHGKYLEDEEASMKDDILTSLEKFYFAESGVFFGGDWKGEALFESSAGLDIFESPDDINSELIDDFIAVARKGSGFLEHELPVFLADDIPAYKIISYISGISEWELYIGSAIDPGSI